jgi:DNA-binding transcriptional ArsR family regulator
MKTHSEAKITKYLENTLGLGAEFAAVAGIGNLPFHLEEAYQLRAFRIIGKDFIVLFAKHDDLTPAAIEKHMDWFRNKTGLRGIFVTDSLEAYNRKRLIERRVPFIVPGAQLYLPDLGLDLNEHLTAAKQRVEQVSPATQVVLLSALLGKLNPFERFSAASLANHFGYSKMTMTRTLDELRGLNLVDTLVDGRYGEFAFLIQGEVLWQQARPHLKSPVKKRIYVENWAERLDFMAGETALADQTMLGKPQRVTWAVTSQQWKQLETTAELRIIPAVSKNAAQTEFEIWSYAPALLSDGNHVDPLSLALSLKNEKDDRVQIAIDELLEDLKW